MRERAGYAAGGRARLALVPPTFVVAARAPLPGVIALAALATALARAR